VDREARMIAYLLGLALAAPIPVDRDGPPFAGDLDEARARATRRAVSVEIALASADQARGEASAWTGRALPALSLFSQLGVGAGFTPFGFERPVPWQIGLGMRGSWSVVDPAGWAAATAARRTARGRDALVAWSRAQARRDAAVAYTQAWSAGRAAELLGASAADARASEAAIADQVAAGVRPAVDASRARADALDLEAMALSAAGEAIAACARLQALIDVPVSGRCALPDPPDRRPVEAPDRHPALIAAEEALGAARSTGDRARFAHVPTLGADGTVAEYIVAERGTGVGWAANVTVDVPLTIATSGPGDLAIARAQIRRAEAELDGQERDLASAALAAGARLSASQGALAARRSALRAAEDAWARTDERYRQGLDGITPWLDARRVRIQAEVALVYAVADVVTATAEVEGVGGVEGE
jgi:outer membrane protein TolC